MMDNKRYKTAMLGISIGYIGLILISIILGIMAQL
jgi:hypothetical protein